MGTQGSPDVSGDRVGQHQSRAAEAGAAAVLHRGPEGTTLMKPRRCLQGFRAGGEPGATYRFLSYGLEWPFFMPSEFSV